MLEYKALWHLSNTSALKNIAVFQVNQRSPLVQNVGIKLKRTHGEKKHIHFFFFFLRETQFDKRLDVDKAGNIWVYLFQNLVGSKRPLDWKLSFKSHINRVTETHTFYTSYIIETTVTIIDKPKKILKNCWSQTNSITVWHFLLVSWIRTLTLQLIQCSAAPTLTRPRRREHTSPFSAALQWPPSTFRIDLRVLLLIYKALNGLGPSYLANSLVHYLLWRTMLLV